MNFVARLPVPQLSGIAESVPAAVPDSSVQSAAQGQSQLERGKKKKKKKNKILVIPNSDPPNKNYIPIPIATCTYM